MTNTLYRFYNASNELLYIGISVHFPVRLKQHLRHKSWAEDIALIRLEQFSNREALMVGEKLAIKAEKPKYNIMFNLEPQVREKSPTGKYKTLLSGLMQCECGALTKGISGGRGVPSYRCTASGCFTIIKRDVADEVVRDALDLQGDLAAQRASLEAVSVTLHRAGPGRRTEQDTRARMTVTA